MKTLFLNPPSYKGFDGGAGSRYQARREIRSFWFPTWLAQPAALIPNSKLIDAPAHDMTLEDVLEKSQDYDLCVIHTSTPTFTGDVETAERLKAQAPNMRIGFVGAHCAVLPEESLQASEIIDFVGREEFDFSVKEIAEGRPYKDVLGISYREGGKISHNPDRPILMEMDKLPSVIDVYKRDLTIEKYFIGYLLHPYVSLYTGRGCPAMCTFCLWPQTVGGHRYRVRSPENVEEEMRRAREYFPQVKEFFFDDDTFTANLPRAREIAKKLKTLGITWSCNSRANVDYETLKVMKDCGLRLLLVGYESGSESILKNIKKGVTLESARRFTKDCKKLGITIHGTFILGLPVETKETIEETVRFACEIDPDTIQVSLAAPYPGTELYAQAKANGWFANPSLVDESGIQDSALNYPDISRKEIFESLERFYKRFYFRPKPLYRIIKSMILDREVRERRLREGKEFFRFLTERKQHVAS